MKNYTNGFGTKDGPDATDALDFDCPHGAGTHLRGGRGEAAPPRLASRIVHHSLTTKRSTSERRKMCAPTSTSKTKTKRVAKSKDTARCVREPAAASGANDGLQSRRIGGRRLRLRRLRPRRLRPRRLRPRRLRPRRLRPRRLRPRRLDHADSTTPTATTPTATTPATTTPTTTTPTSSVLLGNSAVQPTQDSNGADQAQAFSVSNSSTGTAQSISVYVDASNKATGIDRWPLRRQRRTPRYPARLRLALVSSGRGLELSVDRSTGRRRGTYWIALLGTGGPLAFRDQASGRLLHPSVSQFLADNAPVGWQRDRLGAPVLPRLRIRQLR